MALLSNHNDTKSQRLKLSKFSSKDIKINATYSSNSTSFSMKNEAKNHSGGYSCNGQTVVVKTNFEIAGKMKKDGTRATRASVGSHASASLDYMNGHGAEDLENDNDLSNIYDEEGNRLTQEEYKDFKTELNSEDNQAFRRIVISPGQDLSREEMIELVKNTMNNYMESADKSFDYKFAIHTDTNNIHAHVLAVGDAKDINMTKTQLNMLKSSVSENTHQILHNREHNLSQDFNKTLDSELEKTDKEIKELECNIKEQEKSIDKEEKVKLTDKEIDEIIDQVCGLNKQEDMSVGLSL